MDGGREKWSFSLGDGVASSPVAAEDALYIGSADSALYALNLDTGDKLWSFTTGDAVRTTPAVADGVVYFGADDGKVYAVRT